MDERIWKPINNIDMHCFACGQENLHGLRMKFESDGKQLRSELTVPDHLRGWSNLVHGGILSTILDEIMGWTAIHLLSRFILTKGMTVSFRKPVRTGAEVTAAGYIKERINDRKVIVAAEVRDAESDVCASSEGEFVLFTLEEFAGMGVVPENVLDEMTEMFSTP